MRAKANSAAIGKLKNPMSASDGLLNRVWKTCWWIVQNDVAANHPPNPVAILSREIPLSTDGLVRRPPANSSGSQAGD